MITRHPTEENLQEYALDKSGCPAEIAKHIESCENCLAAVAVYQSLFTAITEQPAPTFSFDVSDMVLSGLPEQPAGSPLFSYLLAILFAAAAGIPFYLFWENIINLLAGISHFFLYATVSSAILYLTIRMVKIFRKYQQQFNILNSH